MDSYRRRAIGGLIFGVGLIALLIGAMTDAYSTVVGVIAMLAIWFVGGAITAIILGK